MNILITGSNSFIGKSILLNHNLIKKTRAELNISDFGQLAEFFSENQIDIVIHTGNNGGKRNKKDSGNDFHENVLMLENLLFFKSKFKKLVLFTSGAEYNRANDINNARENDYQSVPSDFYGLSKYLSSHRALNDPNIVSLRLFNCFGYHEDEFRFIKSSMKNYINKKEIQIIQNRYFDFFGINDLNAIINFVISNDIPASENTINCCYSEKSSILEVAEKINNLGNYKVPINIQAESFGQNYTGNNDRLNSLGIQLHGLESELKTMYQELLSEKIALQKENPITSGKSKGRHLLHPVVEEDLEKIINDTTIPWEKLRNKSVLITGASGFLGKYIVYSLLRANEKYDLMLSVTGLARNKEKAETSFAGFLNRKDFSLLIQDVCEPISKDFDFDFIIHAASQASPKYYSIDPVGTINANVIGTFNLLSVAKNSLAQNFVFISGGEVYGIVNEEMVPTKENQFGKLNPTDLRSCYSESKRVAEAMCVAWGHQYGIHTNIVRLYHTYGPGLTLDDGRVYADFISNILNSENIQIKGDGKATRSFCYIADAITGIFKVLFKGEKGEAYNVGNPDGEVSISNLAEILCNLYPEKKLTVALEKRHSHDNYLPSPISRSCPDIEKIKALGWSPQTSLEVGFSRTIDSYL